MMTGEYLYPLIYASGMYVGYTLLPQHPRAGRTTLTAYGILLAGALLDDLVFGLLGPSPGLLFNLVRLSQTVAFVAGSVTLMAAISVDRVPVAPPPSGRPGEEKPLV